jgi:hypothetical protein
MYSTGTSARPGGGKGRGTNAGMEGQGGFGIEGVVVGGSVGSPEVTRQLAGTDLSGGFLRSGAMRTLLSGNIV